MEIILAFLSVLLGIIPIMMYVRHRTKYWNNERKNYLYKSSSIFTCCVVGGVITAYLLAGFIMVLAFGYVTVADEWSPFTNKLVFGFVFGMIFPVAFYALVGFGGGSLQVLLRTLRGNDYKYFAGIG